MESTYNDLSNILIDIFFYLNIPMKSPAASQSPFSALGLDNPLVSAVEEIGFTRPTPVQEQAIPATLEGRDLLVSAETGSGKTAAFLLPALQILINGSPITGGPVVLILSPTRELAQQIEKQCRLLGKYCDFKTGLITGGSDFKRQHFSLVNRDPIIIATPGRLREHLVNDSDCLQDLSLLVIDEADRMLDMGFRDDVLDIIGQCNPDRQTLLFSATLNHPGIAGIANKVLDTPSAIALNTLKDGHSQIEQQIITADDHEHKLRLLTWLLLNENFENALIFANTRLRAAELHDTLRAAGVRVGLLHGDMDQKERNRVMALFRDGIINAMVATDLAARGLDIKTVNLVINFDMPRTGIDYLHRIGRTGRAGELGTAIALVKHTEWNLMCGIERFLNQTFIRRTIEGLEGSFRGPKKMKASGKASGSKPKKEPVKKSKSKKIKIRERDKKNIGKRRTPSSKGEAES